MSESTAARLRRALNKILHRGGLHLSRRVAAFEMEDLLARSASRTPKISTWIDVGASDGAWTLRARRYYPASRFLMFEPLAEQQPSLGKLERRFGYIAVPAVAGAAPGEISFAIDSALDGSAVASPLSNLPTRTLPVETIDARVNRHELAGPYGIKLDTHGHELAVLEGAANTLRNTELLIIEAYNFRLTPGSLRFHELCAWLERAGFRCCDLADPMRRPSDGSLWQIDLAFARATNPLFLTESYR